MKIQGHRTGRTCEAGLRQRYTLHSNLAIQHSGLDDRQPNIYGNI